ncbi:unnamed protein product [Diamesa tonsa]
MSEIKRVPFMTVVSGSTDLLKKPEKDSTTSNTKSKSLRMELNLFQPTAEKFPEFNYKKLLHIEKKKQKKISKLPNGNASGNHEEDPCGGDNNNSDVSRIAKELEEKYGSSSAYGKAFSSKSSKLDLYDRGAGYDENDSFIDNTEAYDELIPEEVETDRGGFYINSGALEFKKLANFERPGATQKNANSNNHNSNNNNSNNNNNNSNNSKPVLNTITNQTNHKDTTTTSSTNATKTDKYHHDVPRKMPSELTVFELDNVDKMNGKSTSSSPGSSRGGKESPESSPSYVFPGRTPRLRDRNARQVQLCVCSGLFAAFLIALIISISYSIYGPRRSPFDNTTSYTTDVIITPNETLPVNFFIIFPLLDEPESNWTMPEVTPEVLKEALDAGKEALGDREMIEENLIAPVLNSPSYRAQRAVSTTLFARIASKRGYVEDHATRFLARKFNHQRNFDGKRWNAGRGPNSNLDTSEKLVCGELPKYRSYDGVCNNRKHPKWGSSMISFRRALNPDYCDGISAPRCASNGKPLASAREISIEVHRPSYYNDPHFSVMLAVWGQFLDHDITATALNQGQNGEPIDCCSAAEPKHPECFPVPLGKGDPYFDDYNISCMNFVRSVPAPNNFLGPREQFNQATAYIDGSVIYGPTEEKAMSLRSMVDGKLSMFITPDNRTLLPVNKDATDGCNEADENAKGKYCFDSGDARANENLHLTSMHLLWARHHNYIVVELKKLNSDWNDEKLYQEGRRIVAAQMQHITYNEFLSVIVGKDASERFGTLSTPEGTVDTYNENVDPSVANEFAAAAFRFAHTLLPGLMMITKELNDTQESVALHNMLFNPYSLYAPRGFDNALHSAMNTSLEKSDPYFTTELTEKLFAKDAHSQVCGLDLVSLNIQRGRDHGLAGYPDWRKHCKLPAVDTWEQFKEAVDSGSYKKIREIYKTPQDVDIYTGGLAEFPVKGGIIGPLLTCLIGDQFIRIKQGDAYWYERTRGPNTFTPEQLREIFNTTLSSIICRNSDNVTVSQRFVMKKVSKTNNMEQCKDIDTFSFKPWKEIKRSSVRFDTQQSNVRTMKKEHSGN